MLSTKPTPSTASDNPAYEKLIRSEPNSFMSPTEKPLSHSRTSFMTPTEKPLSHSRASASGLLPKIVPAAGQEARDSDIKALLPIIEDIFSHDSQTIDAMVTPVAKGVPTSTRLLEDRSFQVGYVTLPQNLAYLIDQIGCEIACQCCGGTTADASATILDKLPEYSWENRLLIVLAAFAMIYGQFWLVSQSYTSNQLAKSVAVLKRLPYMFKQTNVLKNRLDAVKNLNQVILDITKCIVEITQLSSQYNAQDDPMIAKALSHVPTAVKQTIKSIVACACKINELTGLSSEQLGSTVDAWELSSWTHDLRNMHNYLAELLKACLTRIEKRRIEEEFEHLKLMLKTGQADNVIVLSALFGGKDELQPLYDLARGRRVNLDVLRGKYVLLFVTDLDIPQEELAILEQIYSESRGQLTKEHQYEIVWFPVVDPNILQTAAGRKQFEDLQINMKWLRIYDPSLISPAAIMCMKDTELFNFWKQPILGVLDRHGKLASRNAFPMMWIWGSLAFPFTSDREHELWAAETWRIEFIVDAIDQQIADWLSEGIHIVLYGGEDIDWIRKFTTAARSVARDAGIVLQMVYVGKKNPKERVRKAISTIEAENLSYTLNMNIIWYFWVRLESMFFSKQELDSTVDTDPLMAEIAATLYMGGSGHGFAILGRGMAAEMVRANGGSFLTCLTDYFNIWKIQVPEKGFMGALIDHLRGIPVPPHCCKFEVRGTSRGMPDKLKCAECSRPMERMTVYTCCDD
ncbi:hypothetical protein K2173_021125 [Erythroxylum novogranatense]|uniref:Protein SIEVE ELEMENT OCCLUSION B-like n=1 Tax=Erythroxylum novogranatense TaxID=1862640 RepID=A0AAV8TPL1_9ROSI|nr:hypothetical protein K2173_021125 [Erythroxylum novogranatense]